MTRRLGWAAALCAASALALAPAASAHGRRHATAHRIRTHAHAHAAWGTYSAWDEEWLKTSLEGDLFEVIGGGVAQTHTSTWYVRGIGAKYRSDHWRSYQEGAYVAHALGIEVPTSPTPSQQWELEAVSQVTGHTFDVWYTKLEIKDHIQDIEETQAEVEKGQNYYVRKLAADDLPMLKEHLKLAEEAYAAATK